MPGVKGERGEWDGEGGEKVREKIMGEQKKSDWTGGAGAESEIVEKGIVEKWNRQSVGEE